MASFRYIRDNESIKNEEFSRWAALLVEIIVSSCLCVGFTEYKGLMVFWIGFLSREIHIIMCIRQSRKAIWDMRNTLFLTLAVEPTFVAFL